MNKIRGSGLNYSINETPFSIYVTVRKAYIRSKLFPHPETVHKKDTLELESVKNRYAEFLTAFSKLRSDYDDAIHECEENQKLLRPNSPENKT